MEYTNDVIFTVKYNEVNNHLEFTKEKWTSKLKQAMRRHKFMTSTIVACSALIILDIALIWSFASILTTF